LRAEPFHADAAAFILILLPDAEALLAARCWLIADAATAAARADGQRLPDAASAGFASRLMRGRDIFMPAFSFHCASDYFSASLIRQRQLIAAAGLLAFADCR